MSVAIRSDIGRWGMTPEWLLDLDVSAQSVRLFATLAAKWADRETDEAHPTRRELATATHVSLDTIDRAIQELLDAGALTKFDRFDVRGDQIANGYVLHFTAPQPQGRGSPTAPAPTGGRTLAALPIPESVIHIPPSSARANPVLIALEALVTEMVSLTLSGPQTDALALYAEHLLVEDVPRVRDAMGDNRAWKYMQAILSDKSSARRNGLDPWEVRDGQGTSRGSASRSGSQPRAVRGSGLGTRDTRADRSGGVPGFDATGWHPIETDEDIDRAFGLTPGTAAATSGVPVPEVRGRAVGADEP